MKAALMAIADEKSDALVEWVEKAKRPTLVEIEEQVMKFRRELSERAAEMLIEAQEAAAPIEVRCERCGGVAENKGVKRVRVTSQVGDLEIERGYWYCPRCRAGVFPPGRATGSGAGETK
jgi:uncharacterized protein with PIN domain